MAHSVHMDFETVYMPGGDFDVAVAWCDDCDWTGRGDEADVRDEANAHVRKAALEELPGRAAEVLNRFPVVRWDRCTIGDDRHGLPELTAFGWIDRDDGRTDFLLVQLDYDGDPVDFTTSSAKYSEQIMERLYGSAEGHRPCQRIDDVFGESVPNRVEA